MAKNYFLLELKLIFNIKKLILKIKTKIQK